MIRSYAKCGCVVLSGAEWAASSEFGRGGWVEGAIGRSQKEGVGIDAAVSLD